MEKPISQQEDEDASDAGGDADEPGEDADREDAEDNTDDVSEDVPSEDTSGNNANNTGNNGSNNANNGANNSNNNPNNGGNNSNNGGNNSNNGGNNGGPVPNEGWIGGPCETAADCTYEDAVCLTEAEGYPDGQCTRACDRICPDRDGMNSVTFCIEGEDGGMCTSRCDHTLYPETGCRPGYRCRILPRNNEPSYQTGACVPDDGEHIDPETRCLEMLDEMDIIWAPWDYETQYAEGLACTIDDPIRVQSPINGVSYRYFSRETPGTMLMACDLALALHRLGDVLDDYDIDEVLHIGTFNCRTIGGSDRLSQHGHGTAIDIWGLIDERGEEYILEEHWEHDTEDPRSEEAQLLYDVAWRMYDERIFNIVLTPNYNAGHDNHFHVDLTPEAHFIGYGTPPERYFGSSEAMWQQHCPGEP